MVLRLADHDPTAVAELLRRYGLRLRVLGDGAPIPGSYWGDCEAGLQGSELLARADTPLHSILHEACHFICATAARRAVLERDAGGDDAEECAVCYLQIVLADSLSGVGAQRLMQDMDSWGYSFRLGTTAAWFRDDADDARRWLLASGLLDATGLPTGALRC